MLAGTAKADITPNRSVFMDGMIRAGGSTGVHDPLYARALVLANAPEPGQAVALLSVQVCAFGTGDALDIRARIARRTGIPVERIVLAAHHNHSGPATHGFFNPPERAYLAELAETLAALAEQATAALRPALVSCGSAETDRISEYRRLLARDGRVVMNWEAYAPDEIIGPLGAADPEVGVCRIAAEEDPARVIALIFNHAAHPNVLSGENTLLTGEFTGLAERLLEAQFGGMALFVNGAQGSVDVDGRRHRDWEGMERLGRILAETAATAARRAGAPRPARLAAAGATYTVPRRRITPAERAWAEAILARTGGAIEPMPDGVGDDYKAVLLRQLWEAGEGAIPVEQTCVALDGCAFLTFPGELYTEIGLRIKAASPFPHTWIVGLANGYMGYVPTAQAIREGGYAEEIRQVDAAAADIVFERSIALLRSVYSKSIA